MEKTLKFDYNVTRELEVLREFSAGILAGLRRYMKKQNISLDNNKDFSVIMYNNVLATYNNVYRIRTLEDAYVARGKLQIINEGLKELEAIEIHC